ncbi:MAG TPA: C2H2-type zinc finger protein [Candidatus Binatia bacterium]|nr:C2H2-type zinc finger protein [Candidatus Binatia bacterium]
MSFMERKPPYGRKIKNPSKLPKVPPLHEEPLRGIVPGKLVCVICGKTFSTKSQLDRHILTQHESPEGKE